MMMRLLNLGLRGITLISKFILIFFIARFLEPQAVGLYGLVVVTIAYSLYLVGFDFYTYSTRDLLKHDRQVWGKYLKSQGAFFGVMYLLVLPASLLLFAFDLLPWSIAIWFLLLLVMEHISQEMNRLLIVLSEQIAASLVLFLRSGAWCLVAIGWMWLVPEKRTLSTVFECWAAGNLLAIGLGAWRCTKLNAVGWKQGIDWQWIRRGVKVAIPLLIGTLALRGVYTIDRYWFEALVSLEVLGAYVLFIGMCNALMSFLDAGVFMYSYPALIQKHNASDGVGFQQEMKRLWLLTSAFSLFFVVASVIAMPWILSWLDRPVYTEHQQLFWWLLASMMLYAIGMVPHYGLYATGKDKPIVKSHILGLVVFVPAVWVLSRYDAYLAVPASLVIVFFIIFVFKSFVYMRLKKAV